MVWDLVRRFAGGLRLAPQSLGGGGGIMGLNIEILLNLLKIKSPSSSDAVLLDLLMSLELGIIEGINKKHGE